MILYLYLSNFISSFPAFSLNCTAQRDHCSNSATVIFFMRLALCALYARLQTYQTKSFLLLSAYRRCEPTSRRFWPDLVGEGGLSSCNTAHIGGLNTARSLFGIQFFLMLPKKIVVQARLQIIENDFVAENRSTCTVCQNLAAEKVHLAMDFRKVLYVYFSELFEIQRNSICCRKRFAPAVIAVGERTKNLRNFIKPCVLRDARLST